MNLSFNTENGTIYYKISDGDLIITGYSGEDEELKIPMKIEGALVRRIEKKAFMGARKLRVLNLPDSIKVVGDWAFAYCRYLEEATFPRRHMKVGIKPFLGDLRLNNIYLRERKQYPDPAWAAKSEEDRTMVSILLAHSTFLEEADYLFDTKHAGNPDWVDKLDARIRYLMEEPDEEGHTDMILCGEEDIDCTIDNFIKEKRKKKVRVAFLRLLNPYGLEDGMKEMLTEYLLHHSVGCASEETWIVLRDEKGFDRNYYELYVDIGCLNHDNYQATIQDIGSGNPEMKAFFIRWNDSEAATSDEGSYFDKFEI